MTEDEAEAIRSRVLRHVASGKTGFNISGTRTHISSDGVDHYLVWTYYPSAYLLPYESYRATPPEFGIRYLRVPLDVLVAHIWTQENSDD